jgi:hypothetical protein
MASGTLQDYINTMQAASYEIKTLRKANEILSAQMQIVNIFASALGFKAQAMGASEDTAWRLDKHIEMIQVDMAREKEAHNVAPINKVD